LLVVLLLLLLAAAVAEGVWIAKLAADNARLQAQWQDALKNGGPELARKMARQESELQVLRLQAQELLKLRRDVRDLRAGTKELSRLQQENEQLKEAETNTPAPQPTPTTTDMTPAQGNVLDSVARQNWTFAGYSTPAAAVESALWALGQGDIDTYLAGLTDAERARLEAQLQPDSPTVDATMTALTRTVSGATGFRILDQTAISDTEVPVTVQLPGAPTEQLRFVLTFVNGEWRVSSVGE
jgi:hypothetical protein